MKKIIAIVLLITFIGLLSNIFYFHYYLEQSLVIYLFIIFVYLFAFKEKLILFNNDKHNFEPIPDEIDKDDDSDNKID